jgi:hypothetical protein
MTLGAAAAAGVRLIVWCKACQHQVEPAPPRWLSNIARTLRFSIGAGGSSVLSATAGTSIWWSPGQPGDRLTLPSTPLCLPSVLSLRVPDRLPLQVRGHVMPSAGQRYNVVLNVTRADAAPQSCCWARVAQLELALDGGRSILLGRSRNRQNDARRRARPKISKAGAILSPSLAPGSSAWRHSMQSDWLGVGFSSPRRSRHHQTGRVARTGPRGTNAASFLTQASNATILEGAPPAEELLFGHVVAATSFLDRDHTAGHSRQNRRFAARHPSPGVRDRQLDHRMGFHTPARQHAAV